MKTFKGNNELKAKLLAEIKKHREMDAIVQGTYGKGEGKKWRGCAVGCAIKSLNNINGKDFNTSDHSLYETEFGIPRILAKLEDRIFEGLAVEESKTFPERFIEAVPVGVDLEMVWPKFIVWVIGDEKHGVIQYARPDGKKAIQKVIDLYNRKIAGEKIDVNEWLGARKATDAAADAAIAAYAATTATAAYAAATAAYAADAADAAYADAAGIAAYAADAATTAAYAAYAAATADAGAVRKKHYSLMADKLIEIIKETK